MKGIIPYLTRNNPTVLYQNVSNYSSTPAGFMSPFLVRFNMSPQDFSLLLGSIGNGREQVGKTKQYGNVESGLLMTLFLDENYLVVGTYGGLVHSTNQLIGRQTDVCLQITGGFLTPSTSTPEPLIWFTNADNDNNWYSIDAISQDFDVFVTRYTAHGPYAANRIGPGSQEVTGEFFMNYVVLADNINDRVARVDSLVEELENTITTLNQVYVRR